MASSEIAIVCSLKARVGCQNKLCMNSDADETLAQGSATYGPPRHFTRPAIMQSFIVVRPAIFFLFQK